MGPGSRYRTLVIAVLAMVVAYACGGGSSTPPPPPDAAVDAFQSDCGFPGDPGNELGIGKFCDGFSDCATTTGAPLCSTAGDPNTHFCTKTCTRGSTECGTGITCTCESEAPNARCGCTPDVCLN